MAPRHKRTDTSYMARVSCLPGLCIFLLARLMRTMAPKQKLSLQRITLTVLALTTLTVMCLYEIGFNNVNLKPIFLGNSYSQQQSQGRRRVPMQITRAPQVEKEPPWKPRKLFLFAYHRTGSSLTGDIIHHSPQVYYLFEPLRSMLTRSFVKEASTVRKANSFLQELLTCNLTNPLLRKLPPSFLKRTNETSVLERCLHMAVSGETYREFRLLREAARARTQYNTTAYRDCMREAQAVCKRYNLTVLKIIRYNMDAVKDMMTLNPDLGVIYLVRDPRASMWSRMSVFKDPTDAGLKNFSLSLCQEMLDHLEKSRDVYQTFPHRIRFLRYEDLADFPVGVAARMFDFLQLNFTDSMKRNVIKQTYSNSSQFGQKVLSKVKGRKAFNAFSLRRPDASRSASLWRNDITWYVVHVMQTTWTCSKLMDQLGYIKFTSEEEVRNWTYPSRGAYSFVQDLNQSVVDLGYFPPQTP